MYKTEHVMDVENKGKKGEAVILCVQWMFSFMYNEISLAASPPTPTWSEHQSNSSFIQCHYSTNKNVLLKFSQVSQSDLDTQLRSGNSPCLFLTHGHMVHHYKKQFLVLCIICTAWWEVNGRSALCGREKIERLAEDYNLVSVLWILDELRRSKGRFESKSCCYNTNMTTANKM